MTHASQNCAAQMRGAACEWIPTGPSPCMQAITTPKSRAWLCSEGAGQLARPTWQEPMGINPLGVGRGGGHETRGRPTWQQGTPAKKWSSDRDHRFWKAPEASRTVIRLTLQPTPPIAAQASKALGSHRGSRRPHPGPHDDRVSPSARRFPPKAAPPRLPTSWSQASGPHHRPARPRDPPHPHRSIYMSLPSQLELRHPPAIREDSNLRLPFGFAPDLVMPRARAPGPSCHLERCAGHPPHP